MKEIKLTRGKVALVDDEIYPMLIRYKWFAHSAGKTPRNHFTADRHSHYTMSKNGRRRPVAVSMAKQILCTPSGLFIDHINGNSLDNRMDNLRLVTPKQNCWNRGVQRNNKLGITGVRQQGRKYLACIRIEGDLRHLGSFDSIEEAIRARNSEAVKCRGDFARLTETEGC